MRITLCLVLLLGACARPTAPAAPRAVPPEPAPCEVAQHEHARIPQLVDQGRLDRAARVLARCTALCPAEAATFAPDLATVRAALDLAGRTPEELLAEGLTARGQGRRADARRLLDRALVSLERARGARATLDIWPGMSSPHSVAWSASRGVLAVASSEGISLFDASWRLSRWIPSAHPDDIQTLAWAPDGSTLVSGGRDGVIRIWDPSTWTVRRAIDGRDWIRAIAVTPDGKTLLAAGALHVHVWDVATGGALPSLGGFRFEDQGHVGPQLALSPDGRRVAGANDGGSLRIVDRDSGKRIVEVRDLESRPENLLFLPDGRMLFVSVDQTGLLLDSTSGRAVLSLRGHTGRILSAVVSPDGARLFTGSTDGTLRTWSTSTGQLIVTQPSTAATRLTFAAGGRELVAVTSTLWGSALEVWDVSSSRVLHCLGGYTQPEVHAIAPEGRTVATGDTAGGILLWNLATGAPGHAFHDDGGLIRDLVFANEGRRLFSTTLLGYSFRSWDVTAGAQLAAPADLPIAPASFSVTPDGKRAILGTDEGLFRALVWDVEKGRLLHELRHGGPVEAQAISGDTLITASGDGAVRAWGLESGKLHWEIPGEPLALREAVLSPDGRWLAALDSNHHAIQLWDLTRRSRAVLDLAPGRDPGEPIDAPRAWGFCGDEARLGVLPAEGPLLACDPATGERVPAEGCALALARGAVPLVGGGQFVVGHDRASTALWKLDDGEAVMRIRRLAGSTAWLAVAPSGQAELAGVEARAVLRCRIGDEVLPLELCEERLVVPGLYARVLRGDQSYLDP